MVWFTGGFVALSVGLALAGIVTRVKWPHRLKIPAALMLASPYKILASVELEATQTDTRTNQQRELVADRWAPLTADIVRTSRN